MDCGSAIESERSWASTSTTDVENLVSLTYAFMSVALQNDVYFFPQSDIRDTRIFLGEGATSTVYKSSIEPSFGRVKAQVAAIKQKRRRGSWFDQDVSLKSWLGAAYLDLRIMSHSSLECSENVATISDIFGKRWRSKGDSVFPHALFPLLPWKKRRLCRNFSRCSEQAEINS